MKRLTLRTRRLVVMVAGLAAACALTVPAPVAHAATSSYTPNPHEWYFSKWGIQQGVWPVTEGSGVTVAVVDGGVQANLPDLQGVVKPGVNMVGSGNAETDSTPNGGHGTQVAELIAGQGAGRGLDGSAPVGIAPQAKILPVQVTAPDSGSEASIAEGIKYSVDHGAGVINISLGYAVMSSTTCDPRLQQAIGYALAHDVVVVAGSGDMNKTPGPVEPATCAGVLAVGGVGPNGALWRNSTQGPQVAVAAPSDQIYVISDSGQQYSVDSNGTSYSSPLVAAAAALIRSSNPSMPWYQVDQRLIDTAVPDGKAPNNGTGYGVINIGKAVDPSQFPVKASAPNPPYARYQSWLKSSGQSASSGGGAAGESGPSSNTKSSGGSSLLIVIVIAVVVIIVAALIIVLVSRGKRRDPRNPGGGYPGGGYPPPNDYAPPPSPQYPQSGPYASPGQPQYPAPPPGRQYPPPGQQYRPPGQ